MAIDVPRPPTPPDLSAASPRPLIDTLAQLLLPAVPELATVLFSRRIVDQSKQSSRSFSQRRQVILRSVPPFNGHASHIRVDAV
jgi:hypothetical protein